MKSLSKLILILSCISMNQLKTIEQGISQITTDQAPQAIGPYCQAIKAGDYLFISGQLAIDPTTGTLIGHNAEEQTRQVLQNIKAILFAADATFEHVVKAEVYLKNLDDFQAMNKVYAEAFSHAVKPARQAMQVAKLPRDALVEISCIAYIPRAK